MRGADGLILEPRMYVMISRICPPLPIMMCAGMRGKLPDVVKLPPSVTVPFSSFEEALKQPENKDMAQRLEAALKAIPSTSAEEKLRECRDIVMEVRLHAERVEGLLHKMLVQTQTAQSMQPQRASHVFCYV